MAAIDLGDVAYALPSGRVLFSSVSFGVADDQHAAPVGAKRDRQEHRAAPDRGRAGAAGRRARGGWAPALHDRWFLAGLDRFMIFDGDQSVRESLRPPEGWGG